MRAVVVIIEEYLTSMLSERAHIFHEVACPVKEVVLVHVGYLISHRDQTIRREARSNTLHPEAFPLTEYAKWVTFTLQHKHRPSLLTACED